MTKPAPNFALLDSSQPEIAILVEAMLWARHVVQHRPWSTAQQPISEYWWADVLADPRARRSRQPRSWYGKPEAHYTLGDEPRPTILVACTKCDWQAAFTRADLIAAHGADYPMPNLLDYLAAPRCPKIGDHWDRCGAYYVNPIERSSP
jgi:hypothetical protein